MEKPCVVLLSGGLDSATTAALAIEAGFNPCALTFEYGQRHAVETDAARRVADSLKIRNHVIQTIDLRIFGGSALTDDIAVPKHTADETPTSDDEIPVTYVPARNLIFLAFATAYAETVRANDLFIGVSAVDYSGYPDCRPEFIRSFQDTARLGTKIGVEGNPLTIHSPLIGLSKAATIQEASRLNVDLGITHSCYDPDDKGRACGRCDSCHLRRKGFQEAGITDPTIYTQS
ncbi:MAG: 7-cyano-7-deazaguanine synthase QueC [Phycisphaerae bacterium]